MRLVYGKEVQSRRGLTLRRNGWALERKRGDWWIRFASMPGDIMAFIMISRNRIVVVFDCTSGPERRRNVRLYDGRGKLVWKIQRASTTGVLPDYWYPGIRYKRKSRELHVSAVSGWVYKVDLRSGKLLKTIEYSR